MENTRNFVIIAHVDHGKSTLADRMLEVTGTVEARRMRPQYLDQLELERERGITIKMAPVRMKYRLDGKDYVLNLIDTPGHSDFSYEVSRALTAVEGAVLLVDVTKGIQAQTLSNLLAARKIGLHIVGAVNKIDLQPERVDSVVKALADLLQVGNEEILRISGKTGEGVPEVLRAVVEKIPPPRTKLTKQNLGGRALIFDSLYDDHKGILAYIRVLEGKFAAGQEVSLIASKTRCKLKEVGFFAPELKPIAELSAGEMGYLATGFKEPALVRIGDTVGRQAENSGEALDWKELALPGYREATPVVFISFYPDGTSEFDDLKKGLERLRLSDAALSFEPDSNEALGRGLKVGFLGQLHFEITSSRLEREFGLHFMTSFPSIAYQVKEKGRWRTVKDAHEFPDDAEEVRQPIIRARVLTPAAYLSQVLALKTMFQLEVDEVENLGDNVLITGRMPLAELIRDFDDKLKSVSAGFASFSYELMGEESAEVTKLEIMVAGEVASALTRVVFEKDIEREGRATVERLKKLLPQEQFPQALQAKAKGRIIARETIPAMRKDVTGYLYGGDRSRKMKLWKKQKRGKEKLMKMAKVNISADVFREILKK